MFLTLNNVTPFLSVYQEEKAELKAHNYLLGKEKAALDLQLCGKESREQAYLVQIEHLRSEVSERKVGLDPLRHHNKVRYAMMAAILNVLINELLTRK